MTTLTRKQILKAFKFVTCGAFVIDNENRLLIAHPTGLPQDRWSIPKGLSDFEDVTFYNTACRELTEETGIIIDKFSYEMYELGCIEYLNKPKALVGFAFFLDSVVTQQIVCTSTFLHKRYNVHLPEVDDFQWVSVPEALDMIQPEQAELFRQFTIG